MRTSTDHPMGTPLSIPQLLESMAEHFPQRIAIAAPGRTPLTYDGLREQAHQVRKTLKVLGIGRNDRVAVVLPNGPEMAAAFVTIAASATCAPLNPAYRSAELEFYFTDLKARAVIVLSGCDSPAPDIARERGLLVIEVTPDLDGEAGRFALNGEGIDAPVSTGFADPDDLALILHTSGTTARPKKVPLTHVHICTSARNIVAALELSDRDRCLNIMPLHHIHGLIAATLASLMAGGSIVCEPGPDVTRFFAALDEFKPTWYTAAPTLHQAILAHAADYADEIRRSPLRFIRSCSAPLPPQVMAELERVFGAPVVEAYGMTEASHQICSNPLPPRPRKVGSVGVPTGPEVAIADEHGQWLPRGGAGEILIRGASVIHDYEGDPEATAAAFTEGWLRTGDQGVLDDDGYLFITGRLKEIINRGGAKIAPREIEEVLLGHPAVAQAVAFPLPHPTLGENVAAAVVLRKSVGATESEIRQFARARLADFKVPARILLVDHIPKGSTGKVLRSMLAEQFAPLLATETVAPHTPLEWELMGIWQDVLGISQVGMKDNFFELGGDSLSAVRMFVDVEKITGRRLPISILLEASTIKQLGEMLSREATNASWPSLITMQPIGSKPPLFLMHGVGGNVLYLRHLVRHLGLSQPVYGLQSQALDGNDLTVIQIQDMAAHYIKEMRTIQPEGPYFLAGHSFGGLVAFEVAQQLLAQRQEVALLVLIDTLFYNNPFTPADDTSLLGEFFFFLRKVGFHLRTLARRNPREWLAYVLTETGAVKRLPTWGALTPRHALAGKALRREGEAAPGLASPLPPEFQIVDDVNTQAAKEYVPQVYPGRVALFLAPALNVLIRHDPRLPWGLVSGGVEQYTVLGRHAAVVEEPHVRVLATIMRNCLDRAIDASTSAREPSGSFNALAPASVPQGRARR